MSPSCYLAASSVVKHCLLSNVGISHPILPYIAIPTNYPCSFVLDSLRSTTRVLSCVLFPHPGYAWRDQSYLAPSVVIVVRLVVGCLPALKTQLPVLLFTLLVEILLGSSLCDTLTCQCSDASCSVPSRSQTLLCHTTRIHITIWEMQLVPEAI